MASVELRLATHEDAAVLFRWRNDPDTRRNSVSTAPVIWDDHLRWLDRSLGDPARELYVAYIDSEAVGTVRLDFDGDARVSITVAPDCRGKGLAVSLIRAACEAAGERGVIADIRPENMPSIRAFEHAGFRLDCEHEGLLRYRLDSV